MAIEIKNSSKIGSLQYLTTIKSKIDTGKTVNKTKITS